MSTAILSLGMRREEWFELHDHRLYPSFLRDLVTDALEAIWNCTNSYRVIVPRLRAAMEAAETRHVVDLCSGGGGPWTRLQEQLALKEEFPVCVSLTDKYPNKKALARSRAREGIEFHPAPIDATQVPAELSGFRTMFSTFHHFSPAAARSILADAVARKHGIAIFEAAKRSSRVMFAMIAVPFLSWYVTPRIRPFRWSRLVWTYLLPVVPFTLYVDGILSCLRTYSLEDLHELTDGLASDKYRWEVGEQSGGRIGITYLIGSPIRDLATDEQLMCSASISQ